MIVFRNCSTLQTGTVRGQYCSQTMLYTSNWHCYRKIGVGSTGLCPVYAHTHTHTHTHTQTPALTAMHTAAALHVIHKIVVMPVISF